MAEIDLVKLSEVVDQTSIEKFVERCDADIALCPNQSRLDIHNTATCPVTGLPITLGWGGICEVTTCSHNNWN